MASLSRVGDTNALGGKIITGASTVFANNIQVGVHTSAISSHGGGPHAAAKTTAGSPTVFAENKPVLRVGSSTTCGHPIIVGSPDVNCP